MMRPGRIISGKDVRGLMAAGAGFGSWKADKVAGAITKKFSGTEREVNRRFHTLTCDVIMEPVHSDRFYMDMRVYRIVPLMFDKPGVEPEPPVWRGIYLAMEMAPWEETDHASRG